MFIILQFVPTVIKHVIYHEVHAWLPKVNVCVLDIEPFDINFVVLNWQCTILVLIWQCKRGWHARTVNTKERPPHKKKKGAVNFNS